MSLAANPEPPKGRNYPEAKLSGGGAGPSDRLVSQRVAGNVATCGEVGG